MDPTRPHLAARPVVLRRRPRAAAAVVLLGTIAAVSAAEPDRSSPRATFATFLSSMVAVKQGDPSALTGAVECLDLRRVPPLIRADAGPKIAADLKSYLDRVELIDVTSLPVEADGDRWVWRRVAEGEVSLVRSEQEGWLFSPETIDSLPALLDSVRGRDLVEGIEGGGAPRTLASAIRDHAPETLRRRLLLLEVWQWIALAALAFVGVLADRLCRLAVGIWMRRLLGRIQRDRDRQILADFGRPVGIAVMALVWLAVLPPLDLPLKAMAALKVATHLLLAASGVWTAYRLVDLLAAHFSAIAAGTDTKIDDILIPLGRRASKILVIAFGVLFMAQNLQIDVTSLLAGLGLGGLAFALAAKDTVENLFGSATVLIDRPFQVGDWILVGDQEGTVEEIGFRSTRIRTFYNSVITVPNAQLVHTPVDNLGARRYRRVKCMLSLQYDTPPEKIEAFCEGVRELIRRHPYTRKDYYMVYFNEFADFALNVLLYAFHETPDWPTELRERHRLFVDIVRLAQRLGVQFAFPTQTLHVASVPPGLAGEAPAAVPGTRRAPAPGDPIRLGRAEAEAIVAEIGSGERRPPVDFSDPERMGPGR